MKDKNSIIKKYALVSAEPAPNAAKPGREAVEAFLGSSKAAWERGAYLGKFRSILDGLLCELGGAPLDHATPAMVVGAALRYKNPDQRYDPLFALARLKEFFRWARAHGYLARNLRTAAEQVVLHGGRPRLLTAAAASKLLHSLPDGEARLAMVLSLMTGIRLSEVARAYVAKTPASAIGA